MPETEVTKMKVADLKRELKLRGLSTSGNKNELQDRLQNALLDGDLSLDDTAISDVLEEDVGGLTDDDDEDKLLVDDENELLKSPVSTPTNELLQVSPELKAAGKQNLISPAPTKKIILKRENSLLASMAANTSKENDTPKAEISSNGLVRKHTPIVIAKSSIGSGDSAEKKVAELSAKERLELRAKRFGVQANETAATDVAGKPTKIPSKNSNASILENNGNKETDEKQMEALKRRAERFGCVTSSKLAKQDASEKLLKRKERFGIADGNTTTSTTTTTSVAGPTKIPAGTTTSSSGGTTDIWAEKARARLERFKESSTTTTTSPVAIGGTETEAIEDN